MEVKDYHSIIIDVLRTEKGVKLVNFERTIPFVVDLRATKRDIKEAVENIFRAKVEKVRTLINRKGKKIAYVKFSPETDVEAIASSLKIV